LTPRFPARLALFFNFMVSSYGETAIASGVPRRMSWKTTTVTGSVRQFARRGEGAGSGGIVEACRGLTRHRREHGQGDRSGRGYERSEAVHWASMRVAHGWTTEDG
jgi:hypothetical protein